jgi:hypothetical protein
MPMISRTAILLWKAIAADMNYVSISNDILDRDGKKARARNLAGRCISGHVLDWNGIPMTKRH